MRSSSDERSDTCSSQVSTELDLQMEQLEIQSESYTQTFVGSSGLGTRSESRWRRSGALFANVARVFMQTILGFGQINVQFETSSSFLPTLLPGALEHRPLSMNRNPGKKEIPVEYQVQ